MRGGVVAFDGGESSAVAEADVAEVEVAAPIEVAGRAEESGPDAEYGPLDDDACMADGLVLPPAPLEDVGACGATGAFCAAGGANGAPADGWPLRMLIPLRMLSAL